MRLTNTQDGANHIHTVWRDFDRDFSERSGDPELAEGSPDPLRAHYATSPHHRRTRSKY